MQIDTKQQAGVHMIAAERQRQIEKEGYKPSDDDRYISNELEQAADYYRATESDRQGEFAGAPEWPWSFKYFKPTPDDRVRELVKAGALYMAEQDRLGRHRNSHIFTVAKSRLRDKIIQVAGAIDGLTGRHTGAWSK